MRAAGETTRLRLLHLCARGEHTVSDLVAVLGLSQPRVSRHLKILCDAGLLERFRDGHWVYFRVPMSGDGANNAGHILSMTRSDDLQVAADERALQGLLGDQQHAHADPLLRRFNRLIIDCFLSHPVGDLLDIGVGSGAILKLLATKANRAFGIDVDSTVRHAARRNFARASLANCSVRSGDMYRLEFDDAQFDTVVLDEVLLAAERPAAAIAEAARVLRPNGRLLLIEHVDITDARDAAKLLPEMAAAVQMRCGPIRQATDGGGKYLVAMASRPSQNNTRKTA